ncbi:p53-induced death domain-containing protein 1 [Bagarius yarrelli]|uniref:p53-induced death domain-containing protein 1 n=1 Tax=Bagarius yarrelli TaxID=175774 RepID=A0A556THZ9_BAGYA|nr:p53-induced death domain-containing protein 1 [Bagarius yarrelli]
MESEEKWMRTSTGDTSPRDKERQKNYMRAVERNLEELGSASTEGVNTSEGSPEVTASMLSSLQGHGPEEAFHTFLLSSSSSSSSSCPSSSALLSSLSLSSSPQSFLATPVAPMLKSDAVLVDGRLVLDVYQCGGAKMPALWESAPERMKRVRYIRLGSEDKEALEDALSVLPHLTQLRSLAVRGHRFYDARGEPLPGLLTSLPPSISCLSLLVHLDLSFNRLSSLPDCVLSLCHLSELLLCHNLLISLPEEVSGLVALRRLSFLGNKLKTLPSQLGLLQGLQELDLSYNQLMSLPDELGLLENLITLELSSNRLRQLPETLGSLHSLRVLAIHSNELRSIPESVKSLPKLTQLEVRNNPLGRPPTPPPLPPAPAGSLMFSVSPAGCHVFLPGGGELLFPKGSVKVFTQFKWAERKPDQKWIQLEEHDLLLSCPLELLPHGITFEKPVEVCVPYHRTRKREVIVRRYDGVSWSTLPTQTRRGSQKHSCKPHGRPSRLACCTVTHFSWFVAVSRPVRDSCSVLPEGALLVSRYDPGIKLAFPPNCTRDMRTVTLQVLQVAQSVVQDLTGDPHAIASPLLCLSQTPSMDFLQPVKVQLPLPLGLTGLTLDMSRLHLLHGDPVAQTWTDVTAQVSLYITHLYAVFSVTHFSCCISGVVRKVYHRLKQFRVQFLVLQRKTDLTQVLVQCLPSDKVDSRLSSLSEQYDGPQPSDVCNLLEGEQFFAGFERGIDIASDRPDCREGRLAFTFYSHLKNIKEVHVCPTHQQEGTIRGQVSFYRGEVPSDLPEEVAQKRKGHDSQWMATLPLRLPGADQKGSLYAERHYPPLNLGDPESGYLTETNLLAISLRISKDWRNIGMNLGISYQELDRIQFKHRDNLGVMVLEMLFYWAREQEKAGAGAVPRLINALIESGRRDLAEEVEDIVNLGKRKYTESLKRVGLQTEHPTTSTQPQLS